MTNIVAFISSSTNRNHLGDKKLEISFYICNCKFVLRLSKNISVMGRAPLQT